MKITQGRYTAHINQLTFLVIVTRDGDCLHGLPSKHFANIKSAEKGARRMIAKASS